MFYLNQLINVVYNIFSSDKNTLISSDDDPREIPENKEDQKTVNYTTLQETMAKTTKCNGTHAFGYSPFYKNGHCRFCWGLDPDN